MQQELLHTGCTNCNNPNAKRICPCRAACYCNKDCQKEDWPEHKNECLRWRKGEDRPESKDISAWLDLYSRFFKQALKSQLQLHVKSNRDLLSNQLIVYILKFHPTAAEVASRFAYQETRIFDLFNVLESHTIIHGEPCAFQKIAEDIKDEQLAEAAGLDGQQSNFVVGNCLFLSAYKPDTTISVSASARVRFNFDASELDSFAFDSDHDETLRRSLKAFKKSLLNPDRDDLRAWFDVQRSSLQPLFLSQVPSGNLEDYVFIVNVAFNPQAGELTERFSTSRIVGSFPLSDLASCPPSFGFENLSWSDLASNVKQGRSALIDHPRPSSSSGCFALFVPTVAGGFEMPLLIQDFFFESAS